MITARGGGKNERHLLGADRMMFVFVSVSFAACPSPSQTSHTSEKPQLYRHPGAIGRQQNITDSAFGGRRMCWMFAVIAWV